MTRTLDPATRLFISDHQSIHLATVTEQGLPTLVRGLGCRMDAQGVRLRLLANRLQAGDLLAALKAGGRIAAVFSQPENHKTLQVKGADAAVEMPDQQDLQLHHAYTKRSAQRLLHLGITPDYVQTLCACAPADLAVISVTPLNVFQQTPGDKAGDLLPPGADRP